MKPSLLVLILLLGCTVASAQKFNVGAKVGGLMTWPSFGDKDEKHDFSRRLKLGYSAALLIDFPMKNNYNVILEGGYSRKGRRLTFNNNTWENNTTYQFIDAGMFLRKSFKFYLQPTVPSEWFINIGPEINYLFDSKGSISVNGGKGYPYSIVYGQNFAGGYSTMYINDANKWLFNLDIGIGMKAPLKKNQHLMLELRFISGHTFLANKPGEISDLIGFQDTEKTNLKSLVFSIGYTLDRDIQEGRKGKSTLKKQIKKGKK